MSGRVPLVLLPGLLCDNAWKHQVVVLADVAECHVIVMTEDDKPKWRGFLMKPAKFALA